MTLEWLIGWWNLVFLVPFAIALTYLGLYISTGITFGDADADGGHDFGHDAGHGNAGGDTGGDPHADVDHDIDADADADADADHDADGSDHENDGKSASTSHGHLSVLSLIGFGRVPLSLLVMILLLSWGIIGFAATQTLHKSIASGDQIALIVMPCTAVAALVVTSVLARLFGRLMPMNEAPAMGFAHLVGETGVAVLPIDDRFGLARVVQPGGAGIQVSCRVAPGQPPIAAHGPVLMLRFDRTERLFYVTTPHQQETPP